MEKIIQVTRPSMPDFEEYVDEIRDLWDSRWITNMGLKHQTLEKELVAYLDVANIVLFTNGHLALETIISAFDLSGEIVTTPFTFASTTHAIVRNGLTPVFCDINPDDYTIDVNKIEKLITDKTSAILPVHVYGKVCNLEAIEKIGRKYKLKVIYDAAHSFGVKYKGQGIGNFGDASMFSFHATKVFNTIEGGALTFNDSSLLPILNGLKNFGITAPESVDYVGSNAKMNEFQAAMGLCNLRHIERNIDKRKKLVQRYHENLVGVAGIKLSSAQADVEDNYGYFPVVFDGYKMTRDELVKKLEKHNIFARKYFYPLTNSFACYNDLYDIDQTPMAKYVAERVLTLPLYADLSIEKVDRICEIIRS